MTIPKYIVLRVDVMRNGTSMELTNITDEVEDVILKADCRDEPNLSEKPNSSDEPRTDCETCKHKGKYAYCRLCGMPGENNYEPQTDVHDYKGNGKWERSE